MWNSLGHRILRASALVAATSLVVAALRIPRQTSGISWFACPDSDTAQCAFFDVPRDYANLNEDDTVSIFMRKYSANASQENRLGTILVNPGGPGGSGNLFIALVGEKLRAALDGRYDIIGFDPRGVNLTGPWTACFTTEAEPLSLEYQEILLGAPYPHSTISNDRTIINKLRAIQASHNAACIERGNRKILESVGTVFVAQDMVRMVEALGEDGSILGATFAAMRPDLVKRMVLDGISNAESYYDSIWQWGKDGMDDPGWFSVDLRRGWARVLCIRRPAWQLDHETNNRKSSSSLEKHLRTIGPTADGGLASIEQGNATDAYTSLYLPYTNATIEPYNQNVFNRSMQHSGATRESTRAILCSDAAATNILINAHVDYFREIGKITPVGEQWASIISACNRWDLRASQRYTGPWTVAKGLRKTRFPILFVSLDADPVTPLSSALKMSKGFGKESATLLIQQGYGHPSDAHPSLCTIKHVRGYFVDGKVPANGTHCTPEPGFIYPTNTTNSKRAMLDEGGKILLEAVEGLSEARSKLNLATWGF
ncbi:alpha/beta hydrolase family protein [Ceratobasidium sp. AG-Ba]|nr:alpha/beta hydrolase family protein [Ceratobasidium sp. AG-Ba]